MNDNDLALPPYRVVCFTLESRLFKLILAFAFNFKYQREIEH